MDNLSKDDASNVTGWSSLQPGTAGSSEACALANRKLDMMAKFREQPRLSNSISSETSSDDDNDSYESLSLDGGSQGDSNSWLAMDYEQDDDGALEDGQLLEADDEAAASKEDKQRLLLRRRNLWADVVSEQALSASLSQLQSSTITTVVAPPQPPAAARRVGVVVVDDDDDVKTKKDGKPRPRKRKMKRIIKKSAVFTYHDLDAENDDQLDYDDGRGRRGMSPSLRSSASSVAVAAGGGPKSSPRVDFNLLVKALEKSRAAKNRQKHLSSSSPLKKTAAASSSSSVKLRRRGAPARLGPPPGSLKTQQQQQQRRRRRLDTGGGVVSMDESVAVDVSMDGRQLVDALSRALGESQAVETLANCVAVLGNARCVDFYEKTKAKESTGGLTIMDGSRRKTPGGVFFYLIKTSTGVSSGERSRIFTNTETKLRKKKQHKQVAMATASSENPIMGTGSGSSRSPHDQDGKRTEGECGDGGQQDQTMAMRMAVAGDVDDKTL